MLKLLLVLFGLPSIASAQAVSFGPHDVRSVFHIEKSENENQVHYAIRLDENCAPRTEKPVFAYWRNLEEGPDAVSPLLQREQRAYGLAPRQEIRTGTSGTTVRVLLLAIADRPLVFDVRRGQGRCEVRALTTIGGSRAVLTHAFLEVAPFFRVAHLDLFGTRMRDGSEVEERIER
jgi:hypothetical protein